jgi:hypothetical protein
MATIYWRRHYKTGHFFFFPLFSFAEQHQASCGGCGYVAEGRHPGPLPPLPFIDRLGFLIPVGVGGAGLLGLIGLIVFAVATAPPPKPPTAAALEKSALESTLHAGTSSGESELERTLASKVFASMRTDEGLAPSDVGVAVRVKPGPTRRVIVLVQVLSLRDLRPKARRDLLDDARKAIVDDVAAEDVVTIAVKGVFSYGALAQGPEGGDATVEIDEAVPTEHVEKAFEDEVASPLSDAGKD